MPLPHDCDTVKKLSALARLIELIGLYEGITETRALVERIPGYTDRAIRKAKRELEQTAPECRQVGTRVLEPEFRPEPGFRAKRNQGSADSRAHAKSNKLYIINTTTEEDSFPTPEPASQAKRAADKGVSSEPSAARASSARQASMATALTGAPASNEVIRRPDGSLELSPAERADWRPRFGDSDDQLNLALMQAAGYVQAHSSITLLLQVRAQLSRMAREREERDQRYKTAKAAGVREEAAESWASLLARAPQ